MAISRSRAAEYRDRLHNLDINDKTYKVYYNRLRHDYFVESEGRRLRSYEDHKGNITVGIGFNMNRTEAREEWDACFEGEVSFDAVKAGKAKLTEAQVEKLLEKCIKNREELLQSIYGKYWNALKANEQLVILDAYFNAPKIVNRTTRFYKSIKKYVETNEEKYLKEAVEEIEKNSNPGNHIGLQNRRNAQAEILDSTKALIYSKPNQPLLPHEAEIKIIPAHTILPRGIDKIWPKRVNSGYYIWRTRLDDKVRDAHADLEGKVFSSGDILSFRQPGEDFNCRCYKEELPVNAEIISEIIEVKHLRLINTELDLLIGAAKSCVNSLQSYDTNSPLR